MLCCFLMLNILAKACLCNCCIQHGALVLQCQQHALILRLELPAQWQCTIIDLVHVLGVCMQPEHVVYCMHDHGSCSWSWAEEFWYWSVSVLISAGRTSAEASGSCTQQACWGNCQCHVCSWRSAVITCRPLCTTTWWKKFRLALTLTCMCKLEKTSTLFFIPVSWVVPQHASWHAWHEKAWW